MIIARIGGGLGNQMFQYAHGLAVASRIKSELLLDTSDLTSKKKSVTPRKFLLPHFNIPFKLAEPADFRKIGIIPTVNTSFWARMGRQILRKKESFRPVFLRTFIAETSFNHNTDLLKIQDDCYLSGVWQSEKYFKNIENTIREQYTLKNEPTKQTSNWITKITTCNSISIHVRRGDYISSQKTNQLHGTCSPEYYTEAVNLIAKKIESPVFFVFSDDIEWAKNNIQFDLPVFYVSSKDIPDYEELVLMSTCKHNIIANSSFSWWGAWLNTNKEKVVIAPKKWFQVDHINTDDLLPRDWITT